MQDNTSLNLGGDGKFDSMGMYKLTSINLMKDKLVRAKLITQNWPNIRFWMNNIIFGNPLPPQEVMFSVFEWKIEKCLELTEKFDQFF